ncbi:hypothetical protein AOLI_G00072260 [Acnodon oligacanthus]
MSTPNEADCKHPKLTQSVLNSIEASKTPSESGRRLKYALQLQRPGGGDGGHTQSLSPSAIQHCAASAELQRES